MIIMIVWPTDKLVRLDTCHSQAAIIRNDYDKSGCNEYDKWCLPPKDQRRVGEGGGRGCTLRAMNIIMLFKALLQYFFSVQYETVIQNHSYHCVQTL